MVTQQNEHSKWLRPMNALMKALTRIGIAFGPVHILSVPGRRSGRWRTTPVSPFDHDGKRYIVAGEEHADWVRNVRAAGWAILQRGRTSGQKVRLVELPVNERPEKLRAYRENIPGGTAIFKRLYGISGDADSFASLKDVCPVFRIEPGSIHGTRDDLAISADM